MKVGNVEAQLNSSGEIVLERAEVGAMCDLLANGAINLTVQAEPAKA